MSLEGALWDEYDAGHRPKTCERCVDLGLEFCECDPDDGKPTEQDEAFWEWVYPEWDQ